MDIEDRSLRCDNAEEEGTFAEEVCDEQRSSSGKDLTAAAAVAVFSLYVMFIAVRMPNPDTIFTHPGLLPFLTGLTLLLMAVGLAIRAVRREGARSLCQAPWRSVQNYFKDIENLRTLLVS
jgi:hypothetical protein